MNRGRRGSVRGSDGTKKKGPAVDLAPIGIRVFRTGNLEYEVPYLNKDNFANTKAASGVPKPSPPSFVDGQNQYYDYAYQQVNGLTADRAAILTASLPNPKNFSHYFEYEQALLNWKSDVDEVLQRLELPVPMGRYAFRPPPSRRANIGTNTSKEDSQDDSDNSDPMFTPRGSDDASSIESGSRGGDLRNDDAIKLDKSELLSDPWETTLIPAEPDPQRFDTYKDYETALQRWAILSSQVAFIPPHAYQLAGVIPIQVPKQSNRKVVPDALMDTVDEPRKVGLVRVEFWPEFELFEATNSANALRPTATLIKRATTKHYTLKQDDYLSETLDRLKIAFETLEKGGTSRINKFGRSTDHCLPIIHGTLPTRPKPKSKKLRNDALRRIDLTPDNHSRTWDCPDEIEGVDVDFEVPFFDLANFDFASLAAHTLNIPAVQLYDNDMIVALRQAALQLQFVTQLDSTHSWYWPKKTTKALKQKLTKYVTELTSKGAVKLTTVKEILTNGMLRLDNFEDLLPGSQPSTPSTPAASQPPPKPTPVDKNLLYEALKPADFPSVLQLFYLTNEQLSHAKIASYANYALRMNKKLLDHLIETEDVIALSLLSYSVTYFNKIQVDLFPYRQALLDLTLQVIGKKYAETIKLVFIDYYLGIVKTALAKDPEPNSTIDQSIAATRKTIGSKIQATLVADPKFLSELLFRFIGHRSASVSAVLLFISVQLLHDTQSESGSSGNIVDCLVRNAPSMMQNLKLLAKSKLSHARVRLHLYFTFHPLYRDPNHPNYTTNTVSLVQQLHKFACRRLHSILQSPEWAPTILSLFGSQKLSFVAEMSDTTQPLHSDFVAMVSDFALLGLAAVQDSKSSPATAIASASFVFSHPTFVALVDNCTKSIATVDRRIRYVTKTLSVLCKTAWAVGKISIGADSAQTASPPDSIMIQPSVIRQMVTFLKNAKGKEQRFVDEAVMFMLVSLRHLIKHDGVMDMVKKDEDFHATISSICKKPHYGCNMEAWRMFYQMMSYHPGTGELFVKLKVLPNYFDLIGTANGMVVMQHSLRCLYRTLNMDIDSPPKYKGKFEADIKAIVDWIINQHLFIKIHMIYKRLSEDAAGAAFSDLVKLYLTLQSSPLCGKLVKELSKTPDFKDGLRNVLELINEDEDMVRWKKQLAKEKEKREKEEKERKEKEMKEKEKEAKSQKKKDDKDKTKKKK